MRGQVCNGGSGADGGACGRPACRGRAGFADPAGNDARSAPTSPARLLCRERGGRCAQAGPEVHTCLLLPVS